MTALQDGYASAQRGEPLDDHASGQFSEGWRVYHDGKYWEQLAKSVGMTVYGFSFRHSATFVYPNGQHLNVYGAVKDMLDARFALVVDAKLALANWSKYNEHPDEITYQANKLAQIVERIIQ